MIKVNKTALNVDTDDVRNALYVAFLGYDEESVKRNFSKSLIAHLNKLFNDFFKLTKYAKNYIIYCAEDRVYELGYDPDKMQDLTDIEINFKDEDDIKDIFNNIGIDKTKHIYDSRRREESYVNKDAFLLGADAGGLILVVPEYK
jgi:hypothetical protein